MIIAFIANEINEEPQVMNQTILHHYIAFISKPIETRLKRKKKNVLV